MYLRIIITFILLLYKINPIIGQNIEWASKLLYTTEINIYDSNYPELMLGPPSVYPDSLYESNMCDLYADGYVLHDNGNKNELIELEFLKPLPSNKIIIGGVFNDGVIKKITLVLRDHKFKNIFAAKDVEMGTKKVNFEIPYPLETVYGVKVVINHAKINKWNILKGIGITKNDKPIEIKPELSLEAEFTFFKDTIGDNINTHDCFEFNPKLTSDGSTLYFVKECQKDKNQDIWYSEMDSLGKWMDAKSVGKPLNNSSDNFISSVSLDGKTLFVGNTYKPNGEQLGDGISISKLQLDKTWSLPTTIEIPNVKNKSKYVNYFMLHDQSAVLIAMENEKSIGELDLYVSLYNKYKKSWEEPINLGSTINSIFAEDSPYMAFDGQTLYYSSLGQIGFGGFDIYMSKRLDNSWTNWTKPVNIGPKINSKTDDVGFMISNSGDVAYFNSVAFDSVHNMDIYKIKLPALLKQNPQVLIKGKIVCARTGKPIKTQIRFKEKNKKNYESLIILNEDDGTFSFILPHGKEYEIVLESNNYFKITDNISLLDSLNKTKLHKNFSLEPYLDSGYVAVMANLLFEFGTTNISQTSYKDLDMLANKLKQQNKSVIQISGHTDDTGSETFNNKLSLQRASSVVDYLVSKGIRAWRLNAKGFGEQTPIASNATDDGRAQNRRVELLILKTDFTKKVVQNQPTSTYMNSKNNIRSSLNNKKSGI